MAAARSPGEERGEAPPKRESRLERLVPSGRSLLLFATLIAALFGLFAFARETRALAIQRIEVRGAPSPLARDVREALAPLVGRSLLEVSAADVRKRLALIPTVASSQTDRHFPHTLRVYVRAERPIAVVREGSDGWLVSDRGRVIRTLHRPRLSSLPRIWLPRTATVRVGETIADDRATRAILALAPLREDPLLRRVRDVRVSDDELTLVLRSGLELRLGTASSVRLKLAVGRRILPLLAPPGYVDVSVPVRPVASANSQVEG